MKKTVLILAAFGAVSAHATYSLEATKEARKQLEASTENQILEKLEAARLQDEKNRREKFESLNFSVVSEPSTQAPAAAPHMPAITTPVVNSESTTF